MFGLCDYQKKTIFFRWYWMGLALIGIGLAAVAIGNIAGNTAELAGPGVRKVLDSFI